MLTPNILIAAAALVLPASAAFAQAGTDVNHGALAGRSPHKVYRTAAATPACGKSMHSLPAGKLPTLGTHALPARCASASTTMARADSPANPARD